MDSAQLGSLEYGTKDMRLSVSRTSGPGKQERARVWGAKSAEGASPGWCPEWGGPQCRPYSVWRCLGSREDWEEDVHRLKQLQKKSQNFCGQGSQDLRNPPPILFRDRRLAYGTVHSHKTLLTWPSLGFSAYHVESWEGLSLVSTAHQPFPHSHCIDFRAQTHH